jgi:alpha-N-arabinofuranosidase
MLKVDPSLRFIAVGRDRTDWNDEVLAAVGPEIELLSIHHYEPPGDQPDPRWLMARPLYFETWYRELGAQMRQRVPQKRIGLIVNEWNTVLPLPRQHSMEAALYAARLMNVFERTGDVVEMSAVSDLVNGWPGGIIQAGRHGVHVTPTYRAVELYSRHRGDERLAAVVESATFDLADQKGVPIVDVVASRSADGRRYVLKLVNTSFEAPARVTVAIDGWKPGARATQHTLTAPALHTPNTFASPDAVSVTTRAIPAGPRFTVDLPPHAVAVVVLGSQAQH